MSLMVQKGIRGGICHAIHRIIITWKIMIKIKNHYILSIGMWIIYMDGQCQKSCL